ncbi:unnamed protein product [Trichobilharzia regenti]|uniref:IL4_i_Ig domain-containing protein n=1 Tax=Trichobilharzia regenti TaxID=157069 RepID=A0A183VVT0_TRIRE|nr:unnamed protein product [Trichobilharzia regenti]VDQ00466.1 unnamed protein product [Trichobilharzia regenti]
MLRRIDLLIITLLLIFISVQYITAYVIPDSISSTTSGNQSRLLAGEYIHLECLRIYSEAFRNGFWSDFCNSNELLSPFQIWTTLSMCAPQNVWYKQSRYWVAYEQPGFLGSYLFLKPGECINNVRQYGLKSIASIVECVQLSLFSPYPSLTCNYPQQPWRRYFVNTNMADIRQGQVPSPQPLQENQDGQMSKVVNLDNIYAGSLNAAGMREPK